MNNTCKNCSLTIVGMWVNCSICQSRMHKKCAIKENDKYYCDLCYINKKDDNKTHIEQSIKDLTVIRRSHIETYKACPYQFYLEVIAEVDSITSSHAQIGIDLHELFYKASKNLIKTPEEMIEIYTTIWDKNEDKMFNNDIGLYKKMTLEKLKNRLWNQSIHVINSFYNILNKLPNKPFALEETITFDVGDKLPKVQITMDRIDEINNKLYITDWKTGNIITGMRLSNDLQAPLYILAIQKEFNKTVEQFVFEYLKENKQRVFERIDDENYACTVGKRIYKINLTDAIRDVQHIFSQIQNKQFNIPRDAKSMYFTCKTCPYKKQNICQGALLESWNQYNKEWS